MPKQRSQVPPTCFLSHIVSLKPPGLTAAKAKYVGPTNVLPSSFALLLLLSIGSTGVRIFLVLSWIIKLLSTGYTSGGQMVVAQVIFCISACRCLSILHFSANWSLARLHAAFSYADVEI